MRLVLSYCDLRQRSAERSRGSYYIYGCAYPVCTYEPISQSNDWPCNVHNGSEDSPVILYVRRTVVVVQTARYSRSTSTYSRHFPVRDCSATYIYSVLCAQWFHVHNGSAHLYTAILSTGHYRGTIHTCTTCINGIVLRVRS